MRLPSGLFLISAGAIFAVWAWLGGPVALPASPLAGEKLDCISYAPFRPGQSPLDPATRIEARQIEEDLALLAGVTKCVRTYSADFGLDSVPEIARRHGLKVLQGLWLSGDADKNRFQVQTAIDLAKRYPDVIDAVIVGNEVLLRGEMAAADLANTIRGVKAAVPVRVTYADVWEFWLRHRELLDTVDFVTIHILPYWEDFPIRADEAAAHVAAIREKVAAALANKEVFIGETGWPSAGRMREDALPSPANQARVMHDVLAAAKRGNFRVNLIEAFDQPWKRNLEGTVGGHWGLFDAYSRRMKFAWGGAVSNHPNWLWQAAAGAVLAFLTFAAAWTASRRRMPVMQQTWFAVAAMALLSSILVGWTIEKAMVESLGAGGLARSLAWIGVSAAAPLLAATALASRATTPSFAQVLARREERIAQPLPLALALVLIVVCVLALQSALALVFDPRYRDFPFAPLTAAVIPYFAMAFTNPAPAGARAAAETIFAAALALCALYIAVNESFANWQALWFATALVLLAVTLLRSRAAPG